MVQEHCKSGENIFQAGMAKEIKSLPLLRQEGPNHLDTSTSIE